MSSACTLLRIPGSLLTMKGLGCSDLPTQESGKFCYRLGLKRQRPAASHFSNLVPIGFALKSCRFVDRTIHESTMATHPHAKRIRGSTLFFGGSVLLLRS